MRVVLDTNVLLAGFATHGLCEALLKIVYRDHTVILSEHILDEVSRHFSGKFKATKAQTESVVAFLRSSSEIVEPGAVPRGTLRDKDDLPVLGTAVAGGASCLVPETRSFSPWADFRRSTSSRPVPFMTGSGVEKSG